MSTVLTPSKPNLRKPLLCASIGPNSGSGRQSARARGRNLVSEYCWVDIGEPSDFDQLIALIDSEFAPSEVVSELRTSIRPAVRGVLVEKGYIDKDYRSTFYKHYAKKGRGYRDDCIRLHFFAEGVGFDPGTTDLKSAAPSGKVNEGQYYGFIVLRPTIIATIGRSILTPDIRQGARGTAIQAKHKVHLLGYTLTVWGFPSMAQHIDISVCAHVSCWSILRHYSERFPQHRELLLHDITLMASQFDPGGVTPGLGLDIGEAERVFQAAGTYPLIVAKTASTDDRFYAQMLAYLESGFPLFVALDSGGEGHAIVAAGYSWTNPPKPPPYLISHAWEQIESILAVDDNLLPYGCIPVDPVTSPPVGGPVPPYVAMDFFAFIVALPEKIFYPAITVDTYTEDVLYPLLEAELKGLRASDVMLRRYFVTTISRLRDFARSRHSELGTDLLNILMRLNTAQFVWVVEYASDEQWRNGHIAARAILDATASPRDPVPIWLAHDHETALIFDRINPELDFTALKLDRAYDAPLGRMELNLRRVRK